MATYHASVKVGIRGKAASHAAYILRRGRYRDLRSGEVLEAVASGNLPPWSAHDPVTFWEASDAHERANGNAYREFELALPRELSPEQRLGLVRAFVEQELGDRHAYSFAIHTPTAALEGGEQPHVHIMFSDRLRDGIERDPEQYFRRYNAKAPSKGGCRKEQGVVDVSLGARRAARAAQLVALRARWADLINAHLAQAGHSARVDHRSLVDQGIERPAEPHLGGRGVRTLSADAVAAILALRQAEGEVMRSQAEVRGTVLDLSGNLAAARRARAIRPPALTPHAGGITPRATAAAPLPTAPSERQGSEAPWAVPMEPWVLVEARRLREGLATLVDMHRRHRLGNVSRVLTMMFTALDAAQERGQEVAKLDEWEQSLRLDPDLRTRVDQLLAPHRSAIAQAKGKFPGLR